MVDGFTHGPIGVGIVRSPIFVGIASCCSHSRRNSFRSWFLYLVLTSAIQCFFITWASRRHMAADSWLSRSRPGSSRHSFHPRKRRSVAPHQTLAVDASRLLRCRRRCSSCCCCRHPRCRRVGWCRRLVGGVVAAAAGRRRRTVMRHVATVSPSAPAHVRIARIRWGFERRLRRQSVHGEHGTQVEEGRSSCSGRRPGLNKF